ncbi:hypothetical protein, partial [Leptospira borgpetersenii]
GPSLFHGGLSEEIQVIVGLIMIESIMLPFKEAINPSSGTHRSEMLPFPKAGLLDSVESRISYSELPYVQET